MNRKIRWGILGTASICEPVIPAMKRESGSVVAAVASRSKEKAGSFAGRHGIPRTFESYRELLDSGEVDAVYIPLPNGLHAEWTLRALDAGLHVLCEKPLSLNEVEASSVAAAASRKGLVAAEAFMYRHHPVYTKIFELISDGAIGKLKTLDSRFTFMQDTEDSIVTNAALGGGALMDVGCYCVNFSRMIAGCEASRVSAFARYKGVDRAMVGLMEFPNGILATFTTGIDSAEDRTAGIFGETGSLHLDNAWYPGNTEAHIRIKRFGMPDEIITVPGDDPYYLQVKDFTEAILSGRPPRWTLEDAVGNMRVMDELKKSVGI
jgi:predicted dehydrogenase